MSGIRLEISVDDGGLGAAMRRAASELDDLTAPLTASGDLMVESFTSRFDSEMGPGGIPWQPSKPALGLAPRADGKIRPGKTLTDRGALRASMDKAVQGDQVEIGSVSTPTGDVNRKAAALQFGVAGINLPARPWVGFDDQDVADLEDFWTGVMRDAFNGA